MPKMMFKLNCRNEFSFLFCYSGSDVGGLIADIFGDSDEEEEEFEVWNHQKIFCLSTLECGLMDG